MGKGNNASTNHMNFQPKPLFSTASCGQWERPKHRKMTFQAFDATQMYQIFRQLKTLSKFHDLRNKGNSIISLYIKYETDSIQKELQPPTSKY